MVQIAEAIAPVVVRQPILPTLNWEIGPQSSETSSDERLADSGSQTKALIDQTPAALTAPRNAASIPIERTDFANVAFGLRLTIPDRSPVVQFRAESQASRELMGNLGVGTEQTRSHAQVQPAIAGIPDSEPSGGVQSCGNLSGSASSNMPESPSAPLRNPGVLGQLDGVLANIQQPAKPYPIGDRLPADIPLAVPPATARILAGQSNSPSSDRTLPKISNATPMPEPALTPFPSPVRQIAPDSNYPIQTPDFENQLPSPKKNDTTASVVQLATVKSDAPAVGPVNPLGARVSKDSTPDTTQSPHLTPELEAKKVSPESSPKATEVKAKPDWRAGWPEVEEAEPISTASGELPSAKEKSSADISLVNPAQPPAEAGIGTPKMTSPLTTSRENTKLAPPSRTASSQPVSSKISAQEAAVPAANTSEGMRSAASGKTPPAAANPPVTNQLVTHQATQALANQAMSAQPAPSQLASSPSSNQTAASRHSDLPSTKGTGDIDFNPGPQARPARQISLKLTSEDATRVSVDVSEKGGKVQIAVRSADPELTKSLRSDLGDLVGRLEGKGFKTEAWVPTAARHTLAAAAETTDSRNNSGYPRDTGAGTQQRQSRQGNNGSNQRQQARWMAQLKETISIEETRTENQ